MIYDGEPRIGCNNVRSATKLWEKQDDGINRKTTNSCGQNDLKNVEIYLHTY